MVGDLCNSSTLLGGINKATPTCLIMWFVCLSLSFSFVVFLLSLVLNGLLSTCFWHDGKRAAMCFNSDGKRHFRDSRCGFGQTQDPKNNLHLVFVRGHKWMRSTDLNRKGNDNHRREIP